MIAELFNQVFAGAERERQDGDSGGFVGAIGEDAGVADVEVGDVVGAAEAVCDEFLGIIAHAKGAGFVEAGARDIDFTGAEIFAAA